MPKISVVSAVYNSEEYLPGLVESLRAQTDRDFEWIVSDGCSTDGTVRILEAASDVLTKFSSRRDNGIYDALNDAIKLSSGEYYLVLGADDRLSPDAIAEYKNAAASSNADIITAKVKVGERLLSRHRSRPVWVACMMSYISNHSVGCLARRSIHEKIGYYSLKYPICADQLFVKSAFQHGATLFEGDFLAGTCGDAGASSQTPQVISEMYQIQLETGENRFVQYLLYLYRMARAIMFKKK